MPTNGTGYADKAQAEIERRLRKIYQDAQKELIEKLDKHTKRLNAMDKVKRQQLEDGQITEAQYKSWLRGQMFTGEQWKRKVDSLSETMLHANEQANAIIEGKRRAVFGKNYLYQARKISNDLNMGISFDLYDSSTVTRLLRDQPELLPRRKVDKEKDFAWNRENIANAVTQGIIQGDSIPDLARRIAQKTAFHNRKATERYARTAMTGAQNAGRMEMLHEAQAMGIGVKKVWLATLDSRTRDAHAKLDGQEAEVDEPFKSEFGDIMYPGDPAANPANTWNCRCTLIYKYDKYPMQNAKRYDQENHELIENMTYKEWKAYKQSSPVTSVINHVIAQGKDITASWVRRADKFAFEIEDIINAQGFDGLPRLVGPDEFDRMVKEANGGQGFIAQRTYSAPDQETLDAYREMLYNGKWYVDCSTGGAQYGQGMYCAADYTGELTDGIQDEMRHYAKLGQDRLRGEAREIARKKVWQDALQQADTDLDRAYIKDIMHEANTEERRLLRHTTDEQDDYLLNKYAPWFRRADEAQEANAVYYTETLTLDPSAKIITYDELTSSKYAEEVWKFEDLGSAAAALGYDAINAGGHGKSGSYTVILNRTKVIFRRDK